MANKQSTDRNRALLLTHPVYIVTNLRPPGVRATAFLLWQPCRPPDGQFSRDPPGTTARNQSGWGFNPTTTQSADYPCGIGSIPQTSIYLWYPHGYSAEGKHRVQADSGHEPLKRFVPCCRDNRAELSTTLMVQINYQVLKPTTNPLRDARWRFN